MKYELHDQVIVCDKDSKFFARMGIIYEIKDGLYGVEVIGPRPLGLLWFFADFLAPWKMEDHIRYMKESKDSDTVRMAMSMAQSLEGDRPSVGKDPLRQFPGTR